MNTEAVLLFSGQGAQKVGIGRDLYETSEQARVLFQRADEVLGRPLTSIMFEGPEEALTKTVNCQPALFVHGLALLEELKLHIPNLRPVAAAGLSLGEMTAHTAAGAFSFEEGLRIVGKRGELMDEACAKTQGAMAAMIGGDEASVLNLAKECDVDVANLNAPGQIVLSGKIEGIEQAMELAKSRGVRMAKRLKVAGAYHSRLMAEAQEKLGEVLASVTPQTPKIPVICNLLATEVTTTAETRDTLTKQITGSVRWIESMRLLRSQGHQLFIELGPGKILTGLMNRIDPEATVYAVEDLASLKKLAEELRN